MAGSYLPAPPYTPPSTGGGGGTGISLATAKALVSLRKAARAVNGDFTLGADDGTVAFSNEGTDAIGTLGNIATYGSGRTFVIVNNDDTATLNLAADEGDVFSPNGAPLSPPGYEIVPSSFVIIETLPGTTGWRVLLDSNAAGGGGGTAIPMARASVILQVPSLTPDIDATIRRLERTPGSAPDAAGLSGYTTRNEFAYTGTWVDDNDTTFVMLFVADESGSFPSTYAKVVTGGFEAVEVKGLDLITLGCGGATDAGLGTVWYGFNVGSGESNAPDPTQAAIWLQPISMLATDVYLSNGQAVEQAVGRTARRPIVAVADNTTVMTLELDEFGDPVNDIFLIPQAPGRASIDLSPPPGLTKPIEIDIAGLSFDGVSGGTTYGASVFWEYDTPALLFDVINAGAGYDDFGARPQHPQFDVSGSTITLTFDHDYGDPFIWLGDFAAQLGAHGVNLLQLPAMPSTGNNNLAQFVFATTLRGSAASLEYVSGSATGDLDTALAALTSVAGITGYKTGPNMLNTGNGDYGASGGHPHMNTDDSNWPQHHSGRFLVLPPTEAYVAQVITLYRKMRPDEESFTVGTPADWPEFDEEGLANLSTAQAMNALAARGLGSPTPGIPSIVANPTHAANGLLAVIDGNDTDGRIDITVGTANFAVDGALVATVALGTARTGRTLAPVVSQTRQIGGGGVFGAYPLDDHTWTIEVDASELNFGDIVLMYHVGDY